MHHPTPTTERTTHFLSSISEKSARICIKQHCSNYLWTELHHEIYSTAPQHLYLLPSLPSPQTSYPIISKYRLGTQLYYQYLLMLMRVLEKWYFSLQLRLDPTGLLMVVPRNDAIFPKLLSTSYQTILYKAVPTCSCRSALGSRPAPSTVGGVPLARPILTRFLFFGYDT